MSYAKNLDPDLAKKYDFWRSLAWTGAVGGFLGAAAWILTNDTGQRETLFTAATIAVFNMVLCLNMMAATIRKQTARRIVRTQEIYDRIAERRRRAKQQWWDDHYNNETDPDPWKN